MDTCWSVKGIFLGLQGNQETIPGLNAIGTNDNVDFFDETNNAEHVRVKV